MTINMFPECGWTNLPDFSQALYEETYFLPGETYTGWLKRVCHAYSNDTAHAERMMAYTHNYWWHPSTPPSSNAGTDRGLPISCFTKSVPDTKEGIFSTYNEAFNLGANGGGIGTDWSQVREINHKVGSHGGVSSGVIPFLGISDRSSLAISQGGLRRASEAAYLRMDHPEIEEFIDLRKPTGDQNRRSPNLHHGVVIPDAFMEAVINESDWNLISPKTSEIVKTVKAKDLWTKLLEVRQTLKGEPFMLFIDTVNRMKPLGYTLENISVATSNLCTEITLRTDDEHSGVCCLGSINLEYWDEYQHIFDQFIADCSDYLDNILQDFINRTEGMPGFEKSRASAIDERSVGLGVMGYHSLLQRKHIPFESAIAKGLNKQIFKQIEDSANAHNIEVNNPCPMSIRNGLKQRNTHITAIAPTMSISSLCNVTSSGIEPWISNAFTKKVNQGSFPLTNKYLNEHINSYAINHNHSKQWVDDQWASIKKHQGSVQHLDWMEDYAKDVFKTAFEIDQRWVIELAGDRQEFIDQAQSINLFIPGGSHVQLISDIHILAWKRNIKSLYYLRSNPKNTASTDANERKVIEQKESIEAFMEDACIGCA